MMKLGFGIPKISKQPPRFSWRPFIVLGVAVCAALCLRAYTWMRGPVVPTSQVPAIGWDDTVDGGEMPSEETQEPTKDPSVEVPPVADAAPSNVPSEAPHDNEASSDSETHLPLAINLAVPFTSQAPLGIWDVFTEETCEEASFEMVRAYYAGQAEGSLDPASVDADFRAMVASEDALLFGPSISASQFVTFAVTYANTQVRIVENPTAEDLRGFLAAGHPVIIPAFGRKLGNPFFTGEGPLYHMLVLRGYTQTAFITNDPGTRHGQNYQYANDVLLQAIGDWDGDSPDGGTRVLVFEK